MRTKKLYEARGRFFGILLFFCVSMFVSSLWAQTTPKASITKYIGCFSGTDEDKAEVKITVDQDRVSDYLYDFGSGYQTSNVGRLSQGAQTNYSSEENF